MRRCVRRARSRPLRVAILLIDAHEPITEQDLRVLSMVADTGRALVIAFNKWDLVDEDRRLMLDKEVDRDLVRVPWAQRVNISAHTGRAVAKLVPALDTALESWDKRIPTGRLNTWLKEGCGSNAASDAWWSPSSHHVRDAGKHAPADIRSLHHGLPRGRLSPLHRAASA